MKILHIITGLNDGGAEAVLYRLCKSDKKLNHEVISLSGPGKYGKKLEKIGIKTHYFNFKKIFGTLHSIFSLFVLVKRISPDVVQTWMYHADFLGGIIAKLSGVKKIFWGIHHTTLVKNKSKKLTILIARLNCILSKFIPTNIIYCAQKSLEVHYEFGFDKQKGVVIRNGYDTQEFFPMHKKKNDIRNDLQLPNASLNIGHVGRDDPQKDHLNLFNALGIVREKGYDFHATIVGTGLDKENKILVNKIRDYRLQKHVILLGRRDDIPKYMNSLDLFILSSSFGEAFPNVLNEAMACGTVCITTDVGDSKYIVGNTGWIVPPKNPKALATKIIEALEEKNNEPEKWNQRTILSRARIVSKFSIESMVDNYTREWLRV